MHECQEIWSANISQKEDHFLIYERDLMFILLIKGNIPSLPSITDPRQYRGQSIPLNS